LALMVKKAFGQFEARSQASYYPENSWGAVCAQIDEMEKDQTRMVIGV
jgi:hypothetical protein